MRKSKCFGAVVVFAAMLLGCAEAPLANSSLVQEDTLCQVTCTNGSVLSCTTAPCSATATSLTCNGVTTSCTCVPQTCASLGVDCGTVSDGCGGTLSCGTCGLNQQCISNYCETQCPSGKVDCCDDGVCRSPTLCWKIGC